MLQVQTVPVTSFSQNARILSCSETKEAVVLDPGGDVELIVNALDSQGVRCSQIWLTHSHLDHCGGVAPLMSLLVGREGRDSSTPLVLVGHPGEKMLRGNVRGIAAMYGMPSNELFDCPEPTHFVSGGEKLTLGNLVADVLFTPGHSPGHVSFYFKSAKTVASGDVLFSGSIGRTDLPGGDHRQLLRSIETQLMTLEDETIVLCGHGDDTTIGRERRTNPFLQG